MAHNKHEFALYFSLLSQAMKNIIAGTTIQLDDQALCHRILKVLRLEVGEKIILFDDIHHAEVELVECTKRTIGIRLARMQPNKQHAPEITFFLPLLKRADIETALYSLVELGVNSIQLFTTHKTVGSLHTEKELVRFHNIIIAAAEQSKNFAFPALHEPISFTQLLQRVRKPSIFFDPQGTRLMSVLSSLVQDAPASLNLMVGPEGDLTAEEKDMLKKHGVIFCALTPTVLRSVQAVALGAGVMRSMF